MSIERTRTVMNRYWSADHGDVSMLADDVVFTLMPTGQESRGPEAVLNTLNEFYRAAFDAGVEPRMTIFDDGHAVFEGTFVGRHVGEFAGIPATGKTVHVPICIIYDVENEQIKRARVYFELPVLMQQLTATTLPS